MEEHRKRFYSTFYDTICLALRDLYPSEPRNTHELFMICSLCDISGSHGGKYEDDKFVVYNSM
jgi:hypothetical protein